MAVQMIRDIVYDPERELALDLLLPEGSGPFPVFVFFHGGGFEDYRQKDMGEPLGRELAEKGILCVLPAYRHLPKAQFPDFIEDGARAVAWTKAHIGEYAKTAGLYVGGHSAGGYLSMLLCFDDKYLAPCGLNPTKDIDGFLFLSGQPTTHFNVLKGEGLDPKTVVVDDRAPLYHVRPEGPPLLVLCTDHDITNRLAQTELFVATLRHFSYASPVDYRILEGYSHNNYLFPDERKPEKPSLGSRIIAEFIEKTEKGRKEKK